MRSVFPGAMLYEFRSRVSCFLVAKSRTAAMSDASIALRGEDAVRVSPVYHAAVHLEFLRLFSDACLASFVTAPVHRCPV